MNEVFLDTETTGLSFREGHKIVEIACIETKDLISTGNIGCISQISNGTKIPILHTVEIIDWYTGGPQPEVLRKL